MFHRLGHVTYRRRRLVLAARGRLPRPRRGVGDRGLRLDGPQRLRHPGQRVGPRAGPRSRRPSAAAAPTSSCSTATAADRSTTRPSGQPSRTTWPTCPTDLVASRDDVLDGRPAAPRFVSEDRHVDVRRPAAGRRRRRRADGRPTRSSSRACATRRPGWTCRLGGNEAIASDITTQVGEDIARAETLSMPILLVLLVVIFGGLVAASLPLAIGGLAILGASPCCGCSAWSPTCRSSRSTSSRCSASGWRSTTRCSSSAGSARSSRRAGHRGGAGRARWRRPGARSRSPA